MVTSYPLLDRLFDHVYRGLYREFLGRDPLGSEDEFEYRKPRPKINPWLLEPNEKLCPLCMGPAKKKLIPLWKVYDCHECRISW